ncbi:MFS transporter [Rhodococcus sp. UNC363MFTsu5.1]|uniref:MFS transporter n=1 Tax=Rhodococcus sp. UNC363MFTsu5.1 TaxID=1449069 RepID=UPI001E4EE4B9|nr:MFS transporter [Rhodococcus sp. UNC363MFTsu5.1]
MTNVMTRTTQRDNAAEAGIGRGLLLLMSVSTGLVAAGNYFAQPLLDVIRQDLELSTSTAAMVVTAAQAGYALGLILLLPLGDLLERRGLAVALFGATAAFLLMSATAPNGAVLLAGTALAAITSVAAQVLVTFAVALADPEHRGRVVGTVMSGLLLGGLLARTVSGMLSEFGGWRTVYFVNAVLLTVVAVLLWRVLPRLHTPAGMSYPALLRSTVVLFRTEPVLRWRAVIAALSLASFNVFWTSVTFLLVADHYRWSEAVIGLFGLVGVAGTIATPVAGRLADRGYVQWVAGIGTALLAVSWVAIAAGATSLVWLLAGAIALTVAQQSVLNSNQNVIYALAPEIRNRLNSAFMTAFFVGGAAGSALTAVAWVRGGWAGVSALGGALALATFLVWVAERVSARRGTVVPA